MKYTRPNFESLEQELKKLFTSFKECNSFEEALTVFEEINTLRTNFTSMMSLCKVRQSIDTKDTFYEEEKTFFDKVNPIYQSLISQFYTLIINSPFRKELEKEIGGQFFIHAELHIKVNNDKIIEELQKENKLVNEYNKLKAQGKVNFQGKEINLVNLMAFLEDSDRSIRKEAAQGFYGFFADHQEDFDSIYDKLVHLRHEMAGKIGLESFTELGYARMHRADYSPEDVAKFRDAVLKYIVPLTTELYEKQKKRIGIDDPKYFDSPYKFTSGNPHPKDDYDTILTNTQKMYNELSPETGSFFKLMVEKELMDLKSKDGKTIGGYCTHFSKEKMPFIFANFNGTAHDINVLTHEIGHAFQCYSSMKEHSIDEYYWSTADIAEINSMGMEFFAWPWMELFFHEDVHKYRFMHLTDSLLFIPYGVSVDEFQHFVYENPHATPQERNQKWREIEKKYMPYVNYDGNSYLENGGFWQKQMHIYAVPFYYIDYTLALMGALQLWKKIEEKDSNVWDDYISICKNGGSKSFTQILLDANLSSPFEEETIKSVVESARQWISGIDDSKF